MLIDSLYIIVKRGDRMKDAILIKVFGKLIEAKFLSTGCPKKMYSGLIRNNF